MACAPGASDGGGIGGAGGIAGTMGAAGTLGAAGAATSGSAGTTAGSGGASGRGGEGANAGAGGVGGSAGGQAGRGGAGASAGRGGAAGTGGSAGGAGAGGAGGIGGSGTPGSCPAGGWTPGDRRITLMHDGIERAYDPRSPGLCGNDARAAHGDDPGAHNTPALVRGWSRMNPLADQNGFIVAYPAAIDCWNPGPALPGCTMADDDIDPHARRCRHQESRVHRPEARVRRGHLERSHDGPATRMSESGHLRGRGRRRRSDRG